SDSEDNRRKRRKRVSSSSSDSSDNEDEETGHWKSRNGYHNQEDEDMSRLWRRQKVDAVKQHQGESTSAYVERYKDECIHVKVCPEILKILGFMNGINNPELIKRLNDRVPQTFDELMKRTRSFIQEEAAAVTQKMQENLDQNRWVWNSNGSGLFRVCDIRNLLDEKFLPKDEAATRWIKYIPIKINIFAWKVNLDRLPTRVNLAQRGIQVSSLTCPVCSLAHESTSHILFNCSMALDIARLIVRWWDLSSSPIGSYAEWLSWFKDIHMGAKLKSISEGGPTRSSSSSAFHRQMIPGWVSDEEPEAPEEASNYVPGPEHPPSPDYVLGPEHPPSPVYVPEQEYSKYFVPSDAEVPIEDQPLPTDTSPTTLSSGYVADSGPEEDPEEDPTDYPADGGDDDDDDESFGDDADDEDEEASEDEDDDKEEEKHLALTDSSNVPTVDLIPSPPLPIPSPPLPLPSPTHTSPTYAEAPLGYRAAGIQLRAASPSLLLPYTTYRDDIHEEYMSLQKRARFTASTSEFEVRESSAAAARQPGLDVVTVDATLGRPMSREIGYGIEDVWDDMVGDIKERAPTTVEGLSHRVTNLSTTLARDTHEIYIEARHAREAWSHTMSCNKAVHAELLAYRAQVQTHETHIYTRNARIGSLRTLVATLMAQTSSLQTQLTAALGRIQTLEAREPDPARDPEPHDRLVNAGSSFVYFTKMSPKRTATTTTPMTDAKIKALIAQGVATALAEYEATRSRNGDDSHDSGTGVRRHAHTARECTYNDFLKCQPLNFKEVRSKKLEIEIWNLKVKGTDVESVMASKPKTMQEAIEITNDLMDQKVRTLPERQAETKRKLDDTSRNNQNQQQHFKRQNVTRAYTAEPGEKNHTKDLNLCALNATTITMYPSF
nr:RNA-directed DNA polymerase, eukaryota [Tanacetum cinerariifolium]